MTKTNKTRNALFTSIISLLLCVSMLVGTTFAWFTDSVVSGTNVIAAGNLDVELYHSDKDDKDEKVTSTLKLFDDVTLWEPGAVAYENFVVANEGTLALKYQLSINFENETKVNGHGLSEALKVAVVEGGFTGGREDAHKLTNLVPLSSFVLSGELEGETTSETYGIVIYWQPTEDDNLFNMNNDLKGNTLSIDLGVNLFATQEMYEEDSFGEDYDKPAYLPVVYNAEELKAALENNESVQLGADIVLTEEWEPIGDKENKIYYTGTLNGNGYTISGLSVSDGDYVALIEAAKDATIKNLTVKGNVSGANAAGIVARVEGETVIENCVSNVAVTGTTKAGGIACNVTGANAKIVNCVNNGAVSGGNSGIGGIVGYVNNDAYLEITNCENTGAVNSNEDKYAGAAVGYAAGTSTGVISAFTNSGEVTGSLLNDGRYLKDGETVLCGYVGTIGNWKYIEVVNNTAELQAALVNNATVALSSGEYTLPTLAGKEGITIIGAADGSTVIGGENVATGFGSSNFGKDTTIQNVTFSGSTNGVRYSYAQGGTITFDNCTFAGDSTYGFHMDSSNGATLIFNNCTFSGFNAFASDLEKVEFNSCTFLHNGSYGHTNIWSNGYFNDCTWGDKASVSTGGDNGHLYFNNVEESYHHEYIGSAESLFAFAESVNEGGDSWKGQNVSLVADIDLENAAWTPIGQTGATEFKGIFDGQGYTIYNLNVDNSADTNEHTASGLFGWAESNVTIKNVNIVGATVKGNHYVAVIVGYTYSGKISNCNVTNANIVCTHANDYACGDKCGLIAGYAGDESRFTNCSGSDSTVIAGRDGGQLIGAGYNVSVSGCAAENVTVTAGGDCTGNNIRSEIIGRELG